jgi:predicted metal-dependent hydrolase
MIMACQMPAELSITPRDRRFGRGVPLKRWWLKGDPYLSAIYNALSVTFPKGEAFFIDSVRAFRDGTPPGLAAEIADFTKQEVAHTREHVAFNSRIANAGYDVSSLEQAVDDRLAVIRLHPPIVSLAATMALEHFTAILAHELLADPVHLAGADCESEALWKWHAIEEIEHKAVAFDTWLNATAKWSKFARWRLKARLMALVTRHFLIDRTRGALDLLEQDGITGPRAWWGLFRAAFVSPGMVRKILPAWSRYFLRGFHPWNVDDSRLIAGAERELERRHGNEALSLDSARATGDSTITLSPA